MYKDATISHVGDRIVLRTKSGISKVYFVKLPKDITPFGRHAAKPLLQRVASINAIPHTPMICVVAYF
jgi:hypothetical protein